MKLSKINSRGFAHQIILIAVVMVAVIGGVFVSVVKAHNDSSSRSNLEALNKSADSKSNLSANEKSQSQLSTAETTPSTNPPSPTSTVKSTTSTPKSITSSSTKSTPTSPPTSTTTPVPTPSQTPVSALTVLIGNLDNGAQVDITANAVIVPGPISNASARPIVFTANGQTYFAYHQGSAANFTTSASQTASSMAIVAATGSPSLVQAHLDKAANLVDPNISGYLVGYSQGGN